MDVREEFKKFLSELNKDQFYNLCECDELLLDNLRACETSIEEYVDTHTEEELADVFFETYIFYTEEDLKEVFETMQEQVSQDYTITFIGSHTLNARSRADAWDKFYDMIAEIRINIYDERIEK